MGSIRAAVIAVVLNAAVLSLGVFWVQGGAIAQPMTAGEDVAPRNGGGEAAAGEVVRVKPPVWVRRGGAQLDAAVGTALSRADVIATGAGGRAQLRLTDGSLITLGENSSARLETVEREEASGRRNVRIAPLAGILRAAVTKAAPGSSFEMEGAYSVASVRGTDFMVKRLDDDESYLVLEGVVTVRGRPSGSENPTVLVRAGDGTYVESGKPARFAAKWSKEVTEAWLSRVALD